MDTIKIDLSTLVSPPHTDSISGRRFGEAHAEDTHFLEGVLKGDRIEIIIDDQKVKSINDSFIKGFFNLVFKNLKTKKKVQDQVIIVANENFKNLFDKNWTILEAIYNG